MPIAAMSEFGAEVCGGTHGIYGDATCTQLLGKLDATGNGGSETWHWASAPFPGATFHLRLANPPASTARSPQVWDYDDKALTGPVTLTPAPGTAPRWKIRRGVTDVGYLLRTDTDELRWYVVGTEVNEQNQRIKGAPNDVLTFEWFTDAPPSGAYWTCSAGRRPAL